MSQLRHESLSAEKLARNWHVLGIAASIWMGIVSIMGANIIAPMVNVMTMAGIIFAHEYYACLLNGFVALVGVVWHLWAAREHINVIKRLESEASNK